MSDRAVAAGPGLLDGLSLLSEVADELVVRTVRDTHLAWSGRVYAASRDGPAARSTLPRVVHHGIAGAVYTGSAPVCGLPPSAWAPWRPPGADRDSRPAGRVGSSAARSSALSATAWPASGRRWPGRCRCAATAPTCRSTARPSAAAYPAAGADLVVFLPGLCEDETAWDRHARPPRDDVRRRRWPPRAGARSCAGQHRTSRAGQRRPARGAARSDSSTPGRSRWGGSPWLATRWAGLVARVACARRRRGTGAVVAAGHRRGHPRDAAPRRAARRLGVGHGAAGLARLPETAAFGRIIDQRSVGVLDLERGLDRRRRRPLPHARYRLVVRRR